MQKLHVLQTRVYPQTDSGSPAISPRFSATMCLPQLQFKAHKKQSRAINVKQVLRHAPFWRQSMSRNQTILSSSDVSFHWHLILLCLWRKHFKFEQCHQQSLPKKVDSLWQESINVLIYIQQDATLHSLFYLETALHVSPLIIRIANNCIYSIWLTALETRYSYFSYIHFVLICTVVVLCCFVVCMCVWV
jgi:hypothetical protein